MLINLPNLRFGVDYNADADVREINCQQPQQTTHTVKANDWSLLRYQNEQLIGITILDVSARIPTLSQNEQTQNGKIDFWDAYLAFRQRMDLDEIDLDVDDVFANVRDRSTG